MNGPGSCLAIDYGTKRCGLARSDPNRVLSTGLPTFDRRPGRSFHSHLRELLADGDYSLVVLGYPHHEAEAGWGGEEGPSSGSRDSLSAEIRSLAGWIERETGVPVVFWDESLTSFEAEKRLRMARRAQRRDKAAIDRLAAEILLQEFLDAGCPSGERQMSPLAAPPGGAPGVAPAQPDVHPVPRISRDRAGDEKP